MLDGTGALLCSRLQKIPLIHCLLLRSLVIVNCCVVNKQRWNEKGWNNFHCDRKP